MSLMFWFCFLGFCLICVDSDVTDYDYFDYRDSFEDYETEPTDKTVEPSDQKLATSQLTQSTLIKNKDEVNEEAFTGESNEADFTQSDNLSDSLEESLPTTLETVKVEKKRNNSAKALLKPKTKKRKQFQDEDEITTLPTVPTLSVILETTTTTPKPSTTSKPPKPSPTFKTPKPSPSPSPTSKITRSPTTPIPIITTPTHNDPQTSGASFNLNYLYLLLLIIPIIGFILGVIYIFKKPKKREYTETSQHERSNRIRRRSTPSWVFSEPGSSDEEVFTLKDDNNIKIQTF